MEDESLKVLIIEDSEDDAYLVERQLRQHGYRPVCLRVENPQQMRNALAGGSWDLIVSDYLLPSFNALGAISIYRDFDLDIPFVVISGSIGEDVAVETMKHGAHDYLIKDNLTRLAATIDRELREARLRRERRLLREHVFSTLHSVLISIQGTVAESLSGDADDSRLKASMREVSDAAERGLQAITQLSRQAPNTGTLPV